MGGKKQDVSTKLRDFDVFSLTIIFTVFSFLGFLFEGFWSLISFGHWDNHYALVWGPFTIIYGFAVCGLLLLYPLLGKKHILIQFLACFVLGSIFEFFMSWLQELVFHTRSWNYYHLPFNLNGRICLRMSLVWGAVGAVFLKVFASKLIKFAQKPKSRTILNIGFVLFAFMIVNFMVSGFATARYSERHYGLQADGYIEKFIDERFPDDRMRRIYYNMEFVY